jgi:hypothetical protein
MVNIIIGKRHGTSCSENGLEFYENGRGHLEKMYVETFANVSY